MYPWHTSLHSYFLSKISANKLAHAILLTGPSASGKLLFAKQLAKDILCANGNSCGKCKSCLISLHPDQIIVSPVKEQIDVSSIREINLFLLKNTAIARHKVVIIDKADKMNIAASNALLKTLEEPVINACIILCAEQKSSLLPTIISRTQEYKIPQASISEANKFLLNKKLNNTEEELKIALNLSNNIPSKAINLLESGFLNERAEITKVLLDSFFKTNSITILSERLKKYTLSTVIDIWQSILIDLIYIKENNINSVVNIDLLDSLQLVNKCEVKVSFLLKLYEHTLQQKKNTVKTNPNKDLILDNLFFC